LTLTLPGGDIIALPHALAGGFGVALFYRGSWYPYCNAQLRAFQHADSLLALTQPDLSTAAGRSDS
jgi:peroxiredoxin